MYANPVPALYQQYLFNSAMLSYLLCSREHLAGRKVWQIYTHKVFGKVKFGKWTGQTKYVVANSCGGKYRW